MSAIKAPAKFIPDYTAKPLAISRETGRLKGASTLISKRAALKKPFLVETKERVNG